MKREREDDDILEHISEDTDIFSFKHKWNIYVRIRDSTYNNGTYKYSFEDLGLLNDSDLETISNEFEHRLYFEKSVKLIFSFGFIPNGKQIKILVKPFKGKEIIVQANEIFVKIN